MFSLKQKREIAERVQQVLRETNHPELPETEIQFLLHVDGAESWSWAEIHNSGMQKMLNQWRHMYEMEVNPFNETLDISS